MIRSTLCLALMLVSAPVLAQSGHHQGHGTASPAPQAQSAATEGFRAANARMHRDMDIPFTGNVDVDFVRGMIAHHQGAIDMARVQLAHGRDAEMRRLAESITADQEREIAAMLAWLQRNGH